MKTSKKTTSKKSVTKSAKTTSKKAIPKAAAPTAVPSRIDLEGVSVGARVVVEPPIHKVNMACDNSPCNSKEYAQVDIGNSDGKVSPSHRVYRCLKCGNVKSVSVGGVANF